MSKDLALDGYSYCKECDIFYNVKKRKEFVEESMLLTKNSESDGLKECIKECPFCETKICLKIYEEGGV